MSEDEDKLRADLEEEAKRGVREYFILSKAANAAGLLRRYRAGEPLPPGGEERIIAAFRDLMSFNRMEEPAFDYEIDHKDLLWFLETRLGQLVAKQAELAALEEEVQFEVMYARDQGVTWAEVAEIAGTTRQSAYQRWSDQGREKHRQYQRKQREQE